MVLDHVEWDTRDAVSTARTRAGTPLTAAQWAAPAFPGTQDTQDAQDAEFVCLWHPHAAKNTVTKADETRWTDIHRDATVYDVLSALHTLTVRHASCQDVAPDRFRNESVGPALDPGRGHTRFTGLLPQRDGAAWYAACDDSIGCDRIVGDREPDGPPALAPALPQLRVVNKVDWCTTQRVRNARLNVRGGDRPSRELTHKEWQAVVVPPGQSALLRHPAAAMTDTFEPITRCTVLEGGTTVRDLLSAVYALTLKDEQRSPIDGVQAITDSVAFSSIFAGPKVQGMHVLTLVLDS
jgi:hypothetical protein